MAARKEKVAINLLPREGFSSSTFGKILHWIVTSFRYIVMITELIVMAAFISRFWLDAKITDLNDSIKQKQAVIASLTDFENEFRTIQQKLTVFAQTANQQAPQVENLNVVTSYLPANVRLTDYFFSDGVINLKTKTANDSDLAQFIVNLTKSGQFAKVSLESVSSDPQTESFLISSLKLVPKKKGA